MIAAGCLLAMDGDRDQGQGGLVGWIICRRGKNPVDLQYSFGCRHGNACSLSASGRTRILVLQLFTRFTPNGAI